MTSEIRLRLCLLGTPRLEGVGDGPAAVLSQQKRLALLTFLAVRREFVRRDDLVATFWADLDQDRGRRALSQAIHFLRLSLGEDVILKRGVNEIGLAECVASDVAEFGRALRERRLEDAVDLYRGELLQGADGGLTTEFSHWLDAERNHLQRLAGEAASVLACAAYRADDPAAAVRWQRRAVDIRPLDEATLREYIKLLDEAGDAATALAEYDAFRTRMATGFGLDPAPETVKLIGLIRRQRPETSPVRPSERAASLAPVSPDPMAAEPGSDVSLTLSPQATDEDTSRPNRWSIGRRTGKAVLRRTWTPMRRVVGAVLILAAVAAYWVRETWPRDAMGQPIEYPVERIAFLYIELSGDTTGLRYLADGLTEEVIHNLAEIDGLRVVSSDVVRPFRGREPPPADTIVHRLAVNTYIRAKLSNRRGVKHLQLELQNSSHEIIQPLDFDISEDNVFESIEEITRSIVDELRPVLGTAIKFERLRKSTSSSAAWNFYAQAAGLEKVLETFFGLRNVNAMTDIVDRAEEFIALASERDASWSEPHLLHGRLAETVGLLCKINGECDHVAWWNEAVGHATRAIERDSAEAAFELRGRLYHKLALAGGSETDPAVLYERAQDDLQTATRDTLRAGPWSALGAIYLDLGEFAAAREASERAYRKDSFLDDRLRIMTNLFLAEFNLGNDARADAWCRDLQRYQPKHWPAAVCALTMMNWTGIRPAHVDSAWIAVHAATSAPPDVRPALEMLVAPLLWTAGQRDSADSVMRRARTSPGAHDDVRRYEAAALARMGREAEAIAVLNAWIDESPAERSHVSHERWFRPLLANGLNAALRDAPHSAAIQR